MERIRIEMIRLDGGTQPRAKLNDERVAEYAENLQSGVAFPPVEVCYDGQDYWFWDGFHRVHACRAAGLEEMDANVIPGTQADAQWLPTAPIRPTACTAAMRTSSGRCRPLCLIPRPPT